VTGKNNSYWFITPDGSFYRWNSTAQPGENFLVNSQLVAQFDQTLGPANCHDVYYGDRIGYWQLECIQRVEHLVGEGDASAQGRGFQRIAREYMGDHADRVPYVVAARVGRTWSPPSPWPLTIR
jgi:hypothetical protein